MAKSAKTANLFSAAKVVDAPKPPKKKGEKDTVNIGQDLDIVAAIDALVNSLKSVREIHYNNTTKKMVDHFVQDTMINQKRPENFKGVGEESEASCELRKRSSRSVLSESEVEFLDKHNITYGKEVTSPATEEKFFFNPELVADSKLATKISKALLSIPELRNMDVLLKEEAREEVSSPVVSDESFDDAAKITDEDTLRQIFGVIGTTAIKAKLTTQSMDVIFDLIKKTGIKLK